MFFSPTTAQGLRLAAGVALLLMTLSTAADNVYQEPGAYVADAFAGRPPPSEFLWLTGELKEQAERILSHSYRGMRIRYWRDAQSSVWILDEIGKEKPITTGVTVRDGRISDIRVLVFRESRGWEVRHEFFTRQFRHAGLNDRNELDRSVDGITGATLSVRALTRQARLALLFDAHVRTEGNQP